jgi:putative transposase
LLQKLQRDHLDLIRRKQHDEKTDSEELRSLQKRYIVALDNALDQCLHGPIWMKQPEIMHIVRESLVKIEQDEMVTHWCFTIMPNHIHLLFSLDHGLLADAMQLVKGRSAFAANKVLNRRGAFWQHESYDHVVRENEFARIVRYILLNPVKVQLCAQWQDWLGTYLHPSIYGFEKL